MIEWSKEAIFDVKYSSPFRQVIRMIRNAPKLVILQHKGPSRKDHRQIKVTKTNVNSKAGLYITTCITAIQALSVFTIYYQYLVSSPSRFFFGSSIDGVAAVTS